MEPRISGLCAQMVAGIFMSLKSFYCNGRVLPMKLSYLRNHCLMLPEQNYLKRCGAFTYCSFSFISITGDAILDRYKGEVRPFMEIRSFLEILQSTLMDLKVKTILKGHTRKKRLCCGCERSKAKFTDKIFCIELKWFLEYL